MWTCVQVHRQTHKCVRMYAHERASCVCLPERLMLLVSARLVYLSLLPLFAKRLDPRRLVTVLFVRTCVFRFLLRVCPPLPAVGSVALTFEVAVTCVTPWVGVWQTGNADVRGLISEHEGKWHRQNKRETGSLDGNIFFFLASCFGGHRNMKMPCRVWTKS